DEHGFGQLRFEPRARGPFANYEDAMLNAGRLERVNRIGKHIEALFHDHPAKKGDDHLVIGDALRAAPLHVATLRVELLTIDPASPDADIAVHTLSAQNGGGGLRRGKHHFAAVIEAAHDFARKGL